MNSGAHYPAVRKIAVLRANGIGDFVFLLPALDALRAAYPEAEITVLGLPWHVDFLNGRPGPWDRAVAVPRMGGIGEPPDYEHDQAEVKAFFAAQGAEEYDLALQMHGGGRYSNPFTRRLGARLTAGLRTPDAEPLDVNVPYVYFQHEVLRYLEVAAAVGAPLVRLEPRLEVTSADLAAAGAAVPPDAGPLVAIHPGAGDPGRRWLPEKFAALGDALAARGARVLITGSRQERDLVEQVAGMMRRPAVPLAGTVSLAGLVGLFSRCDLVVSNDSGPLHLAGAAGAPTVGIYWCFNMINAGPFFRTHHHPIVSWRLDCPVCGAVEPAERCGHNASFVADIPLDEVRDAAFRLLGWEGTAHIVHEQVTRAQPALPADPVAAERVQE